MTSVVYSSVCPNFVLSTEVGKLMIAEEENNLTLYLEQFIYGLHIYILAVTQ